MSFVWARYRAVRSQDGPSDQHTACVDSGITAQPVCPAAAATVAFMLSQLWLLPTVQHPAVSPLHPCRSALLRFGGGWCSALVAGWLWWRLQKAALLQGTEGKVRVQQPNWYVTALASGAALLCWAALLLRVMLCYPFTSRSYRGFFCVCIISHPSRRDPWAKQRGWGPSILPCRGHACMDCAAAFMAGRVVPPLCPSHERE